MAREPTELPEEKRPGYEVFLTHPAMRDLRRIPRRDAGAVRDAIDGLATDPRAGDCKRIANDRHRRWRKRVGDYRIVYTIDDQGRVVVVSIVRDRSGVYKLLAKRSPE